MRVIDISWPITQNVTEYKDRKTFKLEKTAEFKIDNMRETIITIHSHTGTHIDSPSHFLKDGKTVDQIDLNILIGQCQVLDLTQVDEKITKQDLEKHEIKKEDIILLKTKNSDIDPTQKFYSHFIYLEKSGAQYLAEKQIKCVGIDYLGIERDQPNHETHKILLKKKIPIIEGLRLKEVWTKSGMFYCLPIPIKGIDSCPARAILIEN